MFVYLVSVKILIVKVYYEDSCDTQTGIEDFVYVTT